MSGIDWQHIEQITVLGLGKSGSSVLRFLVRQFSDAMANEKLRINVFDSRTDAPGLDEAKRLIGEKNVHCQRWTIEDTLAADMLVLSPGLDPREEAIALAQQAGVRVLGDVELFASTVDKPVVAITGSNGKSTVTRMVEHIAREAGLDALAAGNIGLPVLDALAREPAVYVLELSSFQLETVSLLKPVAATVLNVSPDHLDRYNGIESYAAAKMKIYSNAAIQVLNRQQPQYWPSAQADVPQITFGTDAEPRDFGLLQQRGEMYVSYAGKAVLGASQLSVQGIHNLLNAQAALALATSLDITVAEAAQYLSRFHGLPHRCQLVAEHHGVKWVNDSKATNIGATEAAITGMRPVVQGKLILIAGGVGKGADFSTLTPALKQVDVLLTIGKDGPAIGTLFNGSRQLKNLSAAVQLAASLATAGDMVLLSPACASFDQFNNFEHRGEQFERAVEACYEQSA